MTTTVGVDIGGSSILAVAYDESGNILGRHRARISADAGCQVARSAVAAVAALGLDEYEAVGIGVPGQVDPETGQVTMALNLGIGTEPCDLAVLIEEDLGAPVSVENDVRAAAMGAHESFRLAGDPVKSLTLVAIGTGISAGVVVDGVLIRGSRGMAGEIGHVVIEESGAPCRCGQRGCLEAVAAGPAIARSWPAGPTGTAASALFRSAADGDPAAEKVAMRIADHLTTALAWLAAAYDTEVLVLAGGVAEAGDPFLGIVRESVARRGAVSELAARRLRPAQVTLANVDDPPGPRGSAELARRQLHQVRVAPAGKASNAK